MARSSSDLKLADVSAGRCRDVLAGHAQDIPVRYSDVPDIRMPSKNIPATARCLDNAERSRRKPIGQHSLGELFEELPLATVREITFLNSAQRRLDQPSRQRERWEMFFRRPRTRRARAAGERVAWAMSGTSEERTGSLGASAGKTFPAAHAEAIASYRQNAQGVLELPLEKHFPPLTRRPSPNPKSEPQHRREIEQRI